MNDNVKALKPATADWSAVTEQLAALRQEIARLTERVSALEAKRARGEESPAFSSPVAPQPSPLLLDDETLAVISAAISAFLGKTPRIRQIRLVGTTSWAQQGRVTIQTSHALAAAHTRSEH
jgi:methylmalonyl-CoA carboxyltransferase large subunit